MTTLPQQIVPVTGAADLWCTYAAVRTMAWLGRTDRLAQPDATAARLLDRRNTDGGYGWSRGMPSDAWATFYCASALSDLGRPLPDPAGLADWLRRTWSGDAYAMTPGQEPDVWATHFSARTTVELCGQNVPDPARLRAWLGCLQTRDGGLAWTPGHAAAGEADVRACYYGAAAWRAMDAYAPASPPWDVTALVEWLQDRQAPSGAFRFAPRDEVDCLWATYRAVAALAALDARPAASPVRWILGQRQRGGGFVRWPGYPVADVWASFCAVGALRQLGGVPLDVADTVEEQLAGFGCVDGGFTYREPGRAADALTVSAAVLGGDGDSSALRLWLEGCRLPNEGGIMYMPGRGAEVRCTLWALAAGAFADDGRAKAGIRDWLAGLQNPDGGFGFWHGRGSDLVSTAAAVGIAEIVGPPAANIDRLRAYAARSAVGGLRPGLQSARILAHAGQPRPRMVDDLLSHHRVRGGGWAAHGNRMPDLLSTYEAVLTADRFGLPVDRAHLNAFLDRTAGDDGVAWSPLAPAGPDPLARCLHRLLRRRVAEPDASLPAVVLS